MSLIDLHCTAPTVLAALPAAAAGALVGPRLVERGLAQLEVVPTRQARRVACIVCGLSGPVAVLGAHRVGSWWLVPALLLWAYGLGALATCDALVQRVPTPFVRTTAVTVGVLLTTAAAASGNWLWVTTAGLSVVCASVVLAACWRFLGMGFGDVRLGALCGLGIVNPSHLSVIVGIVAFAAIIIVQVTATLVRGGTRRTMLPLGPAIVIAVALVVTV